jgi:hypothetical protein
MKRLLLLLTIVFLLVCCTAPSGNKPERYLKTVYIEYLDFTNDFRFPDTQIGYTSAPSFTTSCSYEYNKDQVLKVSGGFKETAGGTSVSIFVFTNSVYDSLVYNGNTVSAYTKPAFYYFSTDNPAKPTVYEMNSDNKIVKFTRRDGYVFNYSYKGNTAAEKNSAGDTLRLFYFDNNNLVRIVRNYTDNNGAVVSVMETLFQNFDDSPNPLYNRYYLAGAYYRAFSKNNFIDRTQNYYVKLANGSLKLLSTSNSSVPITYDDYGYPEFGEYAE